MDQTFKANSHFARKKNSVQLQTGPPPVNLTETKAFAPNQTLPVAINTGVRVNNTEKAKNKIQKLLKQTSASNSNASTLQQQD